MAPGLDELIFRAQERIEAVQIQLAAGATTAKEYLLKLHEILLETWNNPGIQEAVGRALDNARLASDRAVVAVRQIVDSTGIRELPSPHEMLEHVAALCRDRMWRRTAIVFACGMVCGSLMGVSYGYCWGVRILAVPHHRALHSLSDGTTVVVEDGVGATVRRAHDVVVKVRAFSVQPEDRSVLRGRGRRLRELCRIYSQNVTVGRSFSGVVTEMGPAVTRLDIGDEVWGALGDWEGGAARELLHCPSHRLGRSPRTLPPEAAASLPHSATTALYHLHDAGLNSHNAKGRRVLVIGAGSGPGCVILQLLKAWLASITAVCDPRARPLVTALGANEVVTVDWCEDIDGISTGKEANAAICDQLYKELESKAPWDAVLVCRAPQRVPLPPRAFLREGGAIRDLRPRQLATDVMPKVFTSVYGLYLLVRKVFAWARGVHTEPDFLLPVPMDADILDKVASHVEAGNLQTVVDKVYTLQDFELALAHACGMGAIGCTVVRMS